MNGPPPNYFERYATLLRECAAVLIPQDDNAPEFAEADADGTTLRHLMNEVGDRLVPVLERMLASPGPGAAERIAALFDRDPDGYALLRDVLVCCYLSTPAVWKLVGYRGRTPNPPQAGEADRWLSGRILDPVISRGRTR